MRFLDPNTLDKGLISFSAATGVGKLTAQAAQSRAELKIADYQNFDSTSPLIIRNIVLSKPSTTYHITLRTFSTCRPGVSKLQKQGWRRPKLNKI